jgi:magnesium transporter
MRGVQFDSAGAVAICSGPRLVGLVTIERLLAAPSQATVTTVMDAQPPVAAPGVDQEHAAWLAAKRAESGLAVVDEHGHFLGLIPPQRLSAILLEEHDEDLVRLGGFLKSSASARSASQESLGRRLWHRLPWLVVGLVGAMISAVLLAGIEDQISANLAVAYFIPAIVYLADAVGTQTETLAIRGLSVGVGIGGIARREAAAGLLVGVVLAAAMLPAIALLWNDVALAAAVSLAVLAASTVATIVAMALPTYCSVSAMTQLRFGAIGDSRAGPPVHRDLPSCGTSDPLARSPWPSLETQPMISLLQVGTKVLVEDDQMIMTFDTLGDMMGPSCRRDTDGHAHACS